MNDTVAKSKNIFSLNLIAYLRLLNINYKLANDNNLFYAVVANDDVVNNAIATYKADTSLQNFLGAYRELREEINNMRCG